MRSTFIPFPGDFRIDLNPEAFKLTDNYTVEVFTANGQKIIGAKITRSENSIQVKMPLNYTGGQQFRQDRALSEIFPRPDGHQS